MGIGRGVFYNAGYFIGLAFNRASVIVDLNLECFPQGIFFPKILFGYVLCYNNSVGIDKCLLRTAFKHRDIKKLKYFFVGKPDAILKKPLLLPDNKHMAGIFIRRDNPDSFFYIRIAGLELWSQWSGSCGHPEFPHNVYPV